MEDFQTEGKEWEDQERLKINKRKDMAEGGRFRSRGYETRSGPAAVDVDKELRLVVSSARLNGEQKDECKEGEQVEDRSSRRKQRVSWRRSLGGDLEK